MTPVFDQVFEYSPSDDSVGQPYEDTRIELVCATYPNNRTRPEPIPPASILGKIVEHANGWPKVVMNKLVVQNKYGKLLFLDKHPEYFAWLHRFLKFDWCQRGTTKSEFLEFSRQECEQYEGVSNYPFFPSVEGLLYRHPEFNHADGEALDTFLNFFNPATPEDKELIKALVLTLFWGGPEGQRPAFLITSKGNEQIGGVGAGKTTLATLCSRLCGGYISGSLEESGDKLRQRILSPAVPNDQPRVLLLDNLKTDLLSSSSLESLITSSTISAHRLYVGNASIPNLFTCILTLNAAALSSDFASRCMTIQLSPAEYQQNWLTNVNAYIESHLWNIIGDIKRLLDSEGHPLPDSGSTRWATWESAVLSKVENPESVRTKILQRQTQINDDDAQGTEFFGFLLERAGEFAPSNTVVHFSQPDMQSYLNNYSAKPVSRNNVTKVIASMHLPCLHQIARPGKKKFWLFHRTGEPLGDDLIQTFSQLYSSFYN